MYILTDHRPILTKDTKDKPVLSSERADSSGTALARTSSNSKLQTRPLVKEGAKK
jgi:flagellar motor protein MotB